MTHDTFEAFGFAEPVARALTQCGYVKPTPVQQTALTPQIEGRDLLALAETGSGKTAAFVLPILHELALNPVNPAPKEVLSLILAPTRELAIQIDQEVASLSRNMHIRRAVVLGGVSKGPQIHAFKRGVHVLVATPGRLLDHVTSGFCDLRPVRVFVLDEADRMFDMGFIRDIRKIASLLSHKRRTAMLSATMPPEIRKLAHELLKDPERIDLSPKQIVVDRIDQKMMVVRSPEKQSRLHTILKDEAASRVIVFTRTKRGADRVADRLGMAGFGAAAIHGNKAQNARQRALQDFSVGRVRVLVATDIAARGIDVSDITHVINFDMPLEPETYVHRIGRTARKGTSGIAISLCDPSERGEIKAIERLIKQSIEVIDDVGGEALAPMPRSSHRDSSDDAPARGQYKTRQSQGRGRGFDGDRNGPRQGDRHSERRSERSSDRGGDRSNDRARSYAHGTQEGRGNDTPAFTPTVVTSDADANSATPRRFERADADRGSRNGQGRKDFEGRKDFDRTRSARGGSDRRGSDRHDSDRQAQKRPFGERTNHDRFGKDNSEHTAPRTDEKRDQDARPSRDGRNKGYRQRDNRTASPEGGRQHRSDDRRGQDTPRNADHPGEARHNDNRQADQRRGGEPRARQKWGNASASRPNDSAPAARGEDRSDRTGPQGNAAAGNGSKSYGHKSYGAKGSNGPKGSGHGRHNGPRTEGSAPERTKTWRGGGQRPPKFLDGAQPRGRSRPADDTSVA